MKSMFRFFSLVMIFLSFMACSANQNQSNDAELMSTFDKDLDTYFGYMNNRDYENMLSMTNPKLFELVSKETMVNMFKSLYESGLEMRVEEITPVSLSQIVREGNESYCKIKYQGVLTMTLSQTLMANIEMFKTELYKTYKEENIEIDLDKNQIIIDADKFIIAMSKDQENSWNYFELQDGQEEMLSKLIPSSVLSQFNN
jgi:hypothetical protein